FEEEYYDEHLKAYVDSLNLLYVALTRARKDMYIRPYMPKMNRDGSLSYADIGAFMYGVLRMLKEEGESGFLPDDLMNVSFGEKERYARTEREASAFSLDYYPVYSPEERISVKFKYRDYAGDGETLSAVDEGKLLHEIFKSIEYADDAEQAVRNVYLSGMITKKEMEEYGEKIRAYLSEPVPSEWFDRKYKVINERDILFRFGSKVRPDRVIIKDRQATVIDYKFGYAEENKYLKQVQFYRTSLKQMGYREVRGYIWYVRLNKVVEV
ncbi:MAG: Dna2/Cas4 domain-containing protein, partial [Odoribacter sp.]|nr:Dna2/Cas4 domain-containing protein [Odoribacter sp.]